MLKSFLGSFPVFLFDLNFWSHEHEGWVVLVREVGKALIMTHDYSRAIKYYETQIQQDPRLFDLRTDLAELYKKLKAYDDARRVLTEALKMLKEQRDDL